MSSIEEHSTPSSALAVAPPREWPHDDDLDGPDERELTPERRLLCMVVRQLTEELLRATGLDHDQEPGRRAINHVRQVAM